METIIRPNSEEWWQWYHEAVPLETKEPTSLWVCNWLVHTDGKSWKLYLNGLGTSIYMLYPISLKNFCSDIILIKSLYDVYY